MNCPKCEEVLEWARYWAQAKTHSDEDAGWKFAGQEVLKMLTRKPPKAPVEPVAPTSTPEAV